MATGILDPDKLPLGDERTLGRGHGAGEPVATGLDTVVPDGVEIDLDHITSISSE